MNHRARYGVNLLRTRAKNRVLRWLKKQLLGWQVAWNWWRPGLAPELRLGVLVCPWLTRMAGRSVIRKLKIDDAIAGLVRLNRWLQEAAIQAESTSKALLAAFGVQQPNIREVEGAR